MLIKGNGEAQFSKNICIAITGGGKRLKLFIFRSGKRLFFQSAFVDGLDLEATQPKKDFEKVDSQYAVQIGNSRKRNGFEFLEQCPQTFYALVPTIEICGIEIKVFKLLKKWSDMRSADKSYFKLWIGFI